MPTRKLALWGTLFAVGATGTSHAQSNAPIDLEGIRSRHEVTALGAWGFAGDMAAVGATGRRKHDDATPATPADKWHLGSCTKAMTATLIAIFVEDGKLAWSSTLAELFPDIQNMHSSFRAVTLELVLAHRAGLGDMSVFDEGRLWEALWNPELDPVAGRTMVAKAMLAAEPAKAPNTEFSYSNAGYVIAGAAVERLTGKSWEVVIKERLFQPLGMTSCGFGAAGAPRTPPDQPWGHQVRDGRVTPVTPGFLADNPPTLGPAGTVHCAMADWGKFVKLHVKGFRGETTPLLSAATFRKLHTPLVGQDYTPGGWIRAERGWANGPVLTHAGSNTLNGAVTWLAPNRDFAALAVTNRADDPADFATDDAIGAVIAKLLR